MGVTSGSVSTSSYQGRRYVLSWTATQSIENNTSTISWTLKATGGSSSWYAERTLKVVIAGSTVFSKTSRVERYTGTIKTGTLTINHDASGNASFSVSMKAAVYGSSVNCTGSGSFTLTTIPRKSTLSVGNGTLNTAQTLTVTRKSSSFTHTITAKCGSASSTICTKSTSTSISFTPPLSWASQNTTGTSVSVTYTITTYNGDTNIGSNSYTVSCAIPSSVKPSCSVTVSDPTGNLSKYGGYIKGVSKFAVTVKGTSSYGSAIASYKTTANGSTYTASSFTTGVIKSSGTLSVSASVTDKRGRSGNASASCTVLDYAVPAVSKLTVKRCDEDGTANDQGEYAKVTFSASVTSLSSKNTAAYTLKYKKTSEADYTSVTLSDFANVYSVTDGTYIFAADSGSSYDVQISVKDAISAETTKKTSVSTATTIMHWLASGLGMAIGKVAELAGYVEIGFKALFHDVIESTHSDIGYIHTHPSTGYGVGCGVGSGGYNRGIWDKVNSAWIAYLDQNNYFTAKSASTQLKLSTNGNLTLGRVDGNAGAYIALGKYGGLVYEDANDTYAKINFRYQASAGAGWSYTSIAHIVANYVLWSGSYFMNSNHSCTLSQNVTNQTNGIVLIWSYYNGTAATNQDFQMFFIPRHFVNLYGGCGMWITNPYLGIAKYVYVSNTTIRGHANNILTTDSNGVKRNKNNNYVLRAVIGV